MAKSSRGRGRKPRRQVDWVVNNESYGETYSLPNASQTAIALTLPKFYVAYVDPLIAVPQQGYQFPEQDSGQVVYAVRGHIAIDPTTWAAGSTYTCMMRIVKKPIQYAAAQLAVTDPNYTLFTPEFANERFLWQDYVSESQALGTAGEVRRIQWKGVCKLEPDEALWLFLENQTGITQNLRFRPFVRTLMRADGG